MSNGIRVVQRGTTVDQAADFQVEFDSRWPLLEIYDEINVNVTLPTPTLFQESQIISSHQFGFAPVYEWIPDETLPRFYTVPSMSNDYAPRVLVTDKNIVAMAAEVFTATPGVYPTTPIQLKGVIRIYKNNLNLAFESDALQPVATASTPDKTLGFKSLLPGVPGAPRIDDTEYSEFSVNTNAKSLGIHIMGPYQVNPPSGSTNPADRVLTIEHKSGYKPIYWVFIVTHWGQHLTLDGAGHWDTTYTDDTVFDPVLHGQISLEKFQCRAYADTVDINLDGLQSPLTGDFVVAVFHDPVQVAI